MGLISEFNAEKLKVKIYSNKEQMASAAADKVAEVINEMLKTKSEIRMIFAAAKSQDEFLNALIDKNIEWNRVTGFHMDEYIGPGKNNEQLFGNYLRRHLFDKVQFKDIHFIEPFNSSPVEECKRYTVLLKEKPIDIVCMGIGENGHLAFNDPHVANFNDDELVKVVGIDTASRQQQVNDGAFNSLDEVPKHAISLTIPVLLSADYKSVLVPGSLKAAAVKRTLNGNISTDCPATILRETENTVLYLDNDSAKLLQV